MASRTRALHDAGMVAPITATQLHDHLRCPHRVAMDAGADPALRDPVSPFVQLLWDRGVAHEQALVAALDPPPLDLSALHGAEKEAATREAIARGEPLIRGGRLSVDGLLGEPDLLRREPGGYVAIDIKSGAGREGDGEGDGGLKRHYGVQLALYTDLLEQMGLSAGRHGYILDVHGRETRYELDQPLGPRSPCLWELYLKTRQAVRETLAAPAASRPACSAACKLCVWHSACERRLVAAGDLTLLPEVGRAARDTLAEAFGSIEALAAAPLDAFIDGERSAFAGIGAQRLRRFQRRARLAVEPSPQACLTRAIDWPQATTELYFDIETDTLRGLCYLHGFLIRETVATGERRERFEGLFIASPDEAAERTLFAAAMDVFRRHPGACVIHYTPYERTEYRRLAARHPEVAGAAEVEALFSPPRGFDLYADAVRGGSEWPTRDYSIKSLARWCGFEWRDSDPSGAASIEWFDRWARHAEPASRQRLLQYNEDDCRAMRVVLDRMRGLPVIP